MSLLESKGLLWEEALIYNSTNVFAPPYLYKTTRANRKLICFQAYGIGESRCKYINDDLEEVDLLDQYTDEELDELIQELSWNKGQRFPD